MMIADRTREAVGAAARAANAASERSGSGPADMNAIALAAVTGYLRALGCADEAQRVERAGEAG
ncbi:hypothetical protein [Sabulicella glaciei]|uniref:Uncharacterized protein n=1 Tax=Sabulicella glaciei TaxID=2984948 RepID=A0ABT3NRE3_9PROT|nr:hypothetical protein [Roseococcus sp. MDT2-1-1]MCW8084733.1 hypothetical protein [Roseococcus sp. MDT2-1-1]